MKGAGAVIDGNEIYQNEQTGVVVGPCGDFT